MKSTQKNLRFCGCKRAKQIFHGVLSKIGNKRYHSYHDEPDAHQIIEDFRKDHYHDAEDKGDYSSD